MIPVSVAVTGIHMTERHDRALGVDSDRSGEHESSTRGD